MRFEDAVPKGDMPELLGAADIGLHVLADVELFRFGVSPNKVFDYLAAGVPCLTNNRGAIGDLVTEAGAGVAVAPDDLLGGLRALADAGAAERDAMGARGRDLIARRYAIAPRARALEQVLLDAGSPGTP